MFPVALAAVALLGGPALPHAVARVADDRLPVAVTPAAFDPEARGRAHEATIRVVPAVAGTLGIAVVAGTGRTVAEPVAARPVAAGEALTARWDGAGAADGAYVVRVRLVDASGAIIESTAEVRVDTTPPVVRLAGPAAQSVDGRSALIEGTVRDPSGIDRAVLEVTGQDGTQVGTVRLPVEGERARLRWDLRVRGRLLQPGAYALRVRVVDGVGRSAVSSSWTIRIRRAVASRVISSGPRSAQRVALTFDDCFDGASWSRMLATLDRLGVKASFFCNGRYVRAFAAAARRTVRDGHTVGAHTWSHPQMPSLPAAAQRREIARDVDAWWEVARAAPMPYFRPPYGLHDGTTRTQAGELGFAYTVMWDVDPSDYLNPPRGRLVDHVVSRSRAGSIVVMHVNANTAAALPDMVRGLRARGLEPVSLDELLGPRAHLSGRRARG